MKAPNELVAVMKIYFPSFTSGVYAPARLKTKRAFYYVTDNIGKAKARGCFGCERAQSARFSKSEDLPDLLKRQRLIYLYFFAALRK